MTTVFNPGIASDEIAFGLGGVSNDAGELPDFNYCLKGEYVQLDPQPEREKDRRFLADRNLVLRLKDGRALKLIYTGKSGIFRYKVISGSQ